MYTQKVDTIADLLSSKLKLCGLKQAWTQVCDISRRMSLDFWHISKHVLNKLGLVGVNGIPHAISLVPPISISRLNLKQAWLYMMSHVVEPRREPALHQSFQLDTVKKIWLKFAELRKSDFEGPQSQFRNFFDSLLFCDLSTEL